MDVSKVAELSSDCFLLDTDKDQTERCLNGDVFSNHATVSVGQKYNAEHRSSKKYLGNMFR